VYGGTYEHGNREWALDDAWILDLRDRDKWHRIIEGTPHDFSKVHDSDSEDDDDDDKEEEEEEGEDDVETKKKKKKRDAAPRERDESSDESDSGGEEGAQVGAASAKKGKKLSVQEEMEQFRTSLGVDDAAITPRGSEALRDFFARTADHWSREAMAAASAAAAAEAGHTRCKMDEKDVRRAAFALASARFEVLRPHMARLDELERLQTEGEHGAAAGAARAAAGAVSKAAPKKRKAVAKAPGRSPVGMASARK